MYSPSTVGSRNLLLGLVMNLKCVLCCPNSSRVSRVVSKTLLENQVRHNKNYHIMAMGQALYCIICVV